MVGDHASRISFNDIEVGPARWKVLLLIPTIVFIVWWAVSTFLSGDPLWLIDFLK